jgi:Tol biopolymer transport system component
LLRARRPEGSPPMGKWLTSNVVLMDADGKNSTDFGAFLFGANPDLAWSPDEKTLAIGGVIWGPAGHGSDLSPGVIYLLNTTTPVMPRLVTQTGFSPSWSPDGSRIAYTCIGAPNSPARKASVSIIATSDPAKSRVLAEDAWKPGWSNDGGNIAYLSLFRRKARPVICHPDGSNIVPLSDGKRDVRSFAWSPAGKRIAYSDEHTENRAMAGGSLSSQLVQCLNRV